jgi:hypothetical protein
MYIEWKKDCQCEEGPPVQPSFRVSQGINKKGDEITVYIEFDDGHPFCVKCNKNWRVVSKGA